MIGVGIDTGGTCTDAVIYNFETKEILSAGKALTTKSNLEIGIANALDTLSADLLHQAEVVSLSTTLATNACVENKGCRAKLLVIGIRENMIEHLKKVFASYGLDDFSQLILLDAKAENVYSNPYDPDWEELRRNAHTYFDDCDCVGIVQMNPRANGGRFERTALEILRQELDIPITIACEMPMETDILKTCASTLLNARLIPLITNFMDAVHRVLEKRGMQVPLTIVRSDGTLMSEEMARTCPVETLLCGPAASVLGGAELVQEDSALLADMGGTTTDIALIRNKEIMMARDGIYMGQWKTMIKGLDVNAVALGGDSAVRFKDERLYLSNERIIPISVLAAQYDHVVPDLIHLNETANAHTRLLHEFYVLQKDISDKAGYTAYEQSVCQALKAKPLITREFVEKIDGDLYYLNLDRLLAEGIIVKSGLTPTDAMVVKGDLRKYQPAAAEVMMEYVAKNVPNKAETMADDIYELVIRKLYLSIGRRLLRVEYPSVKQYQDPDFADTLLSSFYEQARAGERDRLASMSLTTSYPLIGVGAPIHVFLPRVAQLLGTRAVIPAYAYVANALGSIAGQKVASSDVYIHVEYDAGYCTGFYVVAEGRQQVFMDQDQAVAFAREEAERSIRKKARIQKMKENLPVEYRVEEKYIGNHSGKYLTDIIVHARILDTIL